MYVCVCVGGTYILTSLYCFLFLFLTIQKLHPYALGLLIGGITFLIIFRLTNSYGRYWEVSHLHKQIIEIKLSQVEIPAYPSSIVSFENLYGQT